MYISSLHSSMPSQITFITNSYNISIIPRPLVRLIASGTVALEVLIASLATMSKALSENLNKIKAIKNAASKFSASASEGSRLLPSKNKDDAFQVRIDAGRYDQATKKLNVVLQVNSQASSPGLKDFIKKNSTHGKLATAQFDTAAPDKAAEMQRVIAELEAKGKQNL